MGIIWEQARAKQKIVELEKKKAELEFELAKAKEAVTELENTIKELDKPPTLEKYENWVRQQVGAIPRSETTWAQVKTDLAILGLECMISLAPDTKVFYTDEATLTKMVPFLTYPADYYVAELDIDCDDYSLWAASDASRIFKTNGVYQVWGWMPLGYHAFSLGLIGTGKYKLWEPNAGFECAGELFNAGDNFYRPDKWK